MKQSQFKQLFCFRFFIPGDRHVVKMNANIVFSKSIIFFSEIGDDCSMNRALARPAVPSVAAWPFL